MTESVSSALVYNAINSTIDGIRGKHDSYGSMAAGALSGALFKSTGESHRLRFAICHEKK